ncbi:MAG: ABC transporter ATP-binding protein [Alphaproteobacteria bacterium]
MSTLSARNITVSIGTKAIVLEASLSLSAGELVALVGPNGAGKTTLMRALSGLVPAQGTITLAGKPLGTLSPRERARAVSYLPQGHIFHWPMSVEEIVMLGRAPHGDTFSAAAPDDRAAVAQALAVTETEVFAQRAVTTLSGGEKARVALARALATQAPVLLADEPTAALDPRHQLTVMAMLRRAADSGGAILAIMHDLTLAARFADRVLVMNEGRIVADGPPAQALATERLAAVFGIEAATVEVGGKHVPIAGRAL